MADDTQDLLRLADEVEKATGPDRRLDASIASLVRLEKVPHWARTWSGPWKPTEVGSVVLMQIDGTPGPHFMAREYTASLDAAMTLVPEGWFKLQPDSLKGWAALAVVGPWAHAATPALALCAAALKARAHSTKESDSHVK